MQSLIKIYFPIWIHVAFNIVLMLLVYFPSDLPAQQMYLRATTAAGGTALGTDGSSSFAIGQPFFIKNNSNEGYVSQGVIQLLSIKSNPLPINLLSFTANYNPQDELVDLIWYTASETGNDFFTIERSSNGTDFSPIGYLHGSGYSNTVLRYDHQDEQPLPGISYYRLKQTDFDGAFDYSPVVAVRIDVFSPDFMVYPNPASQYVKISMGYYTEILTSWELSDLTGKILRTGTFAGEHETIFIAELPTGSYLLRIFRNDSLRTWKIIKK